MTNKEFLEIYETCNIVSNSVYNKLGLIAKRFVKNCSSIKEDIEDEIYFFRLEFCNKENDKPLKDEKGNLIFSTENEKLLLKKIREYQNQELRLDLNFLPVKISCELLVNIPPSVFETLNNIVIISDENEFFNINSKS